MTAHSPIRVTGKQLERARREHKLSVSILAMLSGLSEQQVQQLEAESDGAFINQAHRIDCARRLAVAMGYAPDQFLQFDKSSPAVTLKHGRPDAQLPREVWQHLPEAQLEALATLSAIDRPAPPALKAGNSSGSPMIIALLVAIILGGLMLGMSLLR